MSAATSAIEARRLRAAKEKTSALPRSFSERKLKMVRLIGESSNQNPNEVRQRECQEKAKTTLFDFSCQIETTLLSERRSREGGKVSEMVPYIGESSNQLFRILDDWNLILKNIGKEEPKPNLPPKKRKRTWYKPKFTKLKREA